jgi:hypothetical protein
LRENLPFYEVIQKQVCDAHVFTCHASSSQPPLIAMYVVLPCAGANKTEVT